MTPKNAKTPEKAGSPLSAIALDEEDQRYVAPLVAAIKEGKKAEETLLAYLNSIKRRSGAPVGSKIILTQDLKSILLGPAETQ